jgi:hypothetical protein
MGQFGSKGGLRRMAPIKDTQKVIASIGSAQECVSLAEELRNANFRIDESVKAFSASEAIHHSTTGPG